MLVIIHGWSDSAGSFKSITKKLAKQPPEGIGAEITEIYLGDYVSLNDQVNFDDLTDAMSKAWSDHQLPVDPGSVDAVVHSTGALVIRYWLLKNFEPEQVPIKRLLMLAPANFGSPLAHTGRSFWGRAVKGWKGTRLFETGTHILKGLELASTFTWDLANGDLLSDKNYFGTGNILCTILTGNTGYKGISAIANKKGSDGTVRVSTANLNSFKLDLDFSQDVEEIVTIDDRVEFNRAAFGIMDREDHSTIAAKKKGPKNDETWEFIREALLVNDDGFEAWKMKLERHNAEITEIAERRRGTHFDSYQNLVIRVSDTHGRGVDDYLIEFYINDDYTRREKRLTQKIQEDVITNVHAFSDDKSYRSMLINCTKLYKLLDKDGDRLNISVTAHPDIASNMVGYKTYTDDDIGALSLTKEHVENLFRPHMTAMISLKIRRYQDDEVFRFKQETE